MLEVQSRLRCSGSHGQYNEQIPKLSVNTCWKMFVQKCPEAGAIRDTSTSSHPDVGGTVASVVADLVDKGGAVWFVAEVHQELLVQLHPALLRVAIDLQHLASVPGIQHSAWKYIYIIIFMWNQYRQGRTIKEHASNDRTLNKVSLLRCCTRPPKWDNIAFKLLITLPFLWLIDW